MQTQTSAATRRKTEKFKKLIKELAGSTIFTVCFTKRSNGELRQMSCRFDVKKGLSDDPNAQQAYDPLERGLIVVYSIADSGYRSIPIDAIKWIKIRGEVYGFTLSAD